MFGNISANAAVEAPTVVFCCWGATALITSSFEGKFCFVCSGCFVVDPPRKSLNSSVDCVGCCVGC